MADQDFSSQLNQFLQLQNQQMGAQGNLGGGNFTQAAAGIDPMTGQPITNPSPQQMNMGNFQMTANGPQWSPMTAPGITQQVPQGGSSPSDTFMGSTMLPSASRTSSLTPTPGIGNSRYQALMQQLMAQFGQQNTAQQGQYQQLLKSLVGKNGITSQLQNATANYGAGQQALLAENQKAQTGQLEQDLTSRGLGNSTIRSSELSGLNRNQQIAQQNLASNISQQKMSTLPIQANIQQGAFQANPFNQQQGEYLNLISRLGGR